MKNYIKTLTTGLFALTFMIGFAVNVNAQDATGSSDVPVTATVVVDIEVEQVTALAFGNARAGQVVTADPADGTFANVAGGIQSIGKFQVVGGADSNVTVSWDAQIALASETSGIPEAGDEINFNPSISFVPGNSGKDADGEVVGEGNQEHTYNINGDLGSGTNRDTFFVGGTLTAKGSDDDAIQAEATGEYAGNLTITASYN